MSEWQECKLGDVTSKIGSGATPTGGENSYKSEGITLIRSQNVYDFQFDIGGLAFIDEDQASLLNNVSVEENDILINITGESVTRCCLVPKEHLPARVNQHVSIIRPISKDADYKFVFYYLHSIKPALNSIAEIGCTRRALTKGMIENLSIPLPPLLEQRAIAGMLSSLDDKIDLLHRQNKTLEGMAEALWRKMFVEEADPGWKKGKLGDITEINPLRTIKRSATATYLDMSNMPTNGPFPKGWVQREFSNGMKFKNGDTVIARITPCLENGKTAYINFLNNEEIAWGSTEYIVLVPKTGYCSEWLYFLATNDDFRDFAIQNMTGTSGRQRVSGDSIAQYEIAIPTMNISERFRAGVVWHTQGSGKSLSMVFYAGKLIHNLDNPTIVVITDRNDLDQQLFDTFAASASLLGQPPVQAESREHLKSLLKVASGGIVFTTIQKFFPENDSPAYDLLSERRNIIVIADEAHRSQYGFQAKLVDTKDEGGKVDGKRIAYGFAKYLRDAVPNATFIGFTGTPVESTDINTPAVFGDYIDIYDIAQAVEDGATVKIYYESRLAKVNLTEEGRRLIEELDREMIDDGTSCLCVARRQAKPRRRRPNGRNLRPLSAIRCG